MTGNNQVEDSGLETEDRSRRKFQRTVDQDDEFTFRKPTLPASATKLSATDSRSSLAYSNRRRSTLRDQKVLLGPRPLDQSLSGGKRIVSDGTVMATHNTERSFLPSSASMPVLDPRKSREHTFAFDINPNGGVDGRQDEAAFNFLPPVTFHDFQATLASYSPEMKSTMSSPAASSGSRGPSFRSRPDPSQSQFTGGSQASAQRQTRMPQSLSRQPSNSNRVPMQTGITPTAPLSIRTRRQSQLPSAAATTTTTPAAARTPRKSVGPGLLSSMLDGRREEREQNLSRTPSLSKAARRTNLLPTTPVEGSRATMATRASKAKSIHVPVRPPNGPPVMDVTSSSHGLSLDTSNISGASDFLQTPNTPTSQSKRRSGRMSGLGARTTSPTDARRLRRLSTAPSVQPPARPPPEPQSEPLPDLRSTARSPSLIPRKTTATPVSARATPDPATGRYIPPYTLSTSSSYQSLRSLNAAGPTRSTQNPSTSKLPTPKPRNVYSSADRREDEVVPPVPAIPKAYESPQDQIEIPFFSSHKPSVTEKVSPPLDAVSSNGSERTTRADRRMEEQPTHYDSMDSPRHRRTMTAGPPTPREEISATPALIKKSLQPVRLPPLNLLPLSTPTTARIASFPAPSVEVDRRQATPPPRRVFSHTPTTPMTASKATFQRRYDDEGPPTNIRSNTSHHAQRGGGDQEGSDDSENGVPLPVPRFENRQITPFASGSLPKGGNETQSISRPPTDEYNLGHPEVPVQASKPMGPRLRSLPKSMTESNLALHPDLPAPKYTSATNDEVETPSSATSLRRKLSFGWRRSSSKNASRHASEDAAQQKHDDMPPPRRLPASATFHALPDFNAVRAQALQTRPSLEADRKRPSQMSTPTGVDAGAQAQNKRTPVDSNQAIRPLRLDIGQPVAPRSSSTSWSNRMQPPAPKTSMSNLNARSGPRLDKDDLLANEEMRRLSTKRREVDAAAKETEELRKRATAKDKISPVQAIQSSVGNLNIFEKGEVIDYKEGVYFCGTKSAKKHVGDLSAAGTANFGYDDERGDYNIVVGDHLAYRYEIIDVLGKGSFGQVVRCIDHKYGGLCAVKIIRNKKRFHQQALVEVSILGKLKEWDPDGVHATLTITSSFYFRSHLCIVTPCLSINLYELIRAHAFTGFSIPLIRRFARQLVACLRLLQKKRVIHCDLKPENILLCDPRRADVRVIDFGSSCKADEKVYTYIQSRFYRSPEVILGSEYGLGIDMWSLGCILAELYTGYPIFPGENEQEQLACIMEIFGPPSREIVEKCSRRKLFFDSSLKPRVTVSSKGRRRRPSSKTLSASLKCDDEAFLDFISQCLRWDPERRIRPDQAMSHPFLTNEPMRRAPIDRPKIRTAAAQAGPTMPLGTNPSPIRRVNTTTAAVSTSTSNVPGQTPIKNRPLPDAPQTAMRNGIPIRPQESGINSSPIKNAAATARRQSSMPMANGNGSVPNLTIPSNPANPLVGNGNWAFAGNKRASNGVLLQNNGGGGGQMSNGATLGGGAAGSNNASGNNNTSLPRVSSAKVDLASAAASAAAGAVARWRS